MGNEKTRAGLPGQAQGKLRGAVRLVAAAAKAKPTVGNSDEIENKSPNAPKVRAQERNKVVPPGNHHPTTTTSDVANDMISVLGELGKLTESLSSSRCCDMFTKNSSRRFFCRRFHVGSLTSTSGGWLIVDADSNPSDDQGSIARKGTISQSGSPSFQPRGVLYQPTGSLVSAQNPSRGSSRTTSKSCFQKRGCFKFKFQHQNHGVIHCYMYFKDLEDIRVHSKRHVLSFRVANPLELCATHYDNKDSSSRLEMELENEEQVIKLRHFFAEAQIDAFIS